jgi:hypothetical protein
MIYFLFRHFIMQIDLILLNYTYVGYLIMFTQYNPMEYRAMMIMIPCQHGIFLLVWVSIN